MQRWQRFSPIKRRGVSWLLLPLALELATCGGLPGVVVDIGSWPDQATSLRVDGAVNGIPFTAPLFFGNGTTRFVVYLPEGDSGQLSLDLAALDGSGCTRATAQTQLEVGSGLRRVAEADVMMTAVAPPTGMPRLDRIMPALGTTAAATPLTLTGSNFACGAAVSVGGVACTQVTVVSPTQITCTYPGKAMTCGGQNVVVSQPDNQTSDTLAAAMGLRLVSATFGLAAATNSPFAVGTQPSSVAVGDFNGDGKLDLATANLGSNNVTVLLGNGMGGFAAATNSPFAAGMGPLPIAVGDFNGDGKLDLATGNYNGANVSVLLGNGMGGFAAAAGSPFAAGTNPVSVAVGDFNGDQKPDLAIANLGSNNVSVLLGNGMGGFAAATNSPFAVGAGTFGVVVGDFNADQKLDFATANQGNNNVSVLLGNGMGGFAAATSSPFAVGSGPKTVAVGDFNGDGKLDLVAANGNNNNVSVLLGNGMGGFAAANSPFAVGTDPRLLAVGDFNSDGKLDLATANQVSNDLSVLLGNGMGGVAAATNSPFAVGTLPLSVAVGDFNGDGQLDFATANQMSNNVSVLLQTCQ